MAPPADTRRMRMRSRLDNALRLLVRGRVTPAYRAPFEVVLADSIVKLRRYHAPGSASPQRSPVLLVPPLMVTSEIYDIAPDLSAVAFLARHGVPTHVADFGPPEAQEGGLDRTLDDHVLAVLRCVDHLRATYGRDVHLVGYSQGGMFCYQAAAYCRSQGIASLVTLGSPVDIRRNVPIKINDKIVELIVNAWRGLIDRPLEGLRGLPGTMSSRGFKLLAPLQEIRHLVELIGVLHDEEALARIEPKRRFLGGEGFISWPGPALRAFIDQFVVENRMKQGGFVIAGRTVALADITSPICFLVGEADDLALPEAVHAIASAAPRAPSYPVHVAAGHFGLVVGRAAMSVCWPTVLAWTAWRDGVGIRPEILDLAASMSPAEAAEARGARALVGRGAELLWERMGDVGVRLGKTADAMRWQLPRRLRKRLLELSERAAVSAHVSLSRTLRERAGDMPDAVAFVYSGRAFTYARADERVDVIARALAAVGVAIGTHVAVAGGAHPDLLTALVALNRLGAIALPRSLADLAARPGHDDVPLAGATLVVVIRADLAAARARIAALPLAVIGRAAADDAAAGEGVFDLEIARPETEPDPLLDPGRLTDPAITLAAHGDVADTLDNRRWAGIGLELAIAARLTAADTIYCARTLELASLVLVLSAALQGGARLQLGLAGTDDGAAIWQEILNSGATVVVVDDELSRALADAPLPPRHPVRFVLGDLLSSESAQVLVDRLGVRTRYRPLASTAR